MKKLNHLFTWLVCVSVIIGSGSCKKDELNSKELLVYLSGDYASPDNRVYIPFIHTPVSVIGNTTVTIPAYATREVPADIHVNMMADMTLVDKFNMENSTGFLPLPAGSYAVTDAGERVIESGSLVSEPWHIEITNPAVLNDPKGYLLPITIESIDSRDKGVRISTTHRTAFLNITYAFNNVEDTETPGTGIPLDRTGWNVTVSNFTNGYTAANLVDNSFSTVWRSSNSSSAEKWIMIDMGSLKNMDGLILGPNYVSRTENPISITVSTSEDNITWTEQGNWTGSGPSASSDANSPDLKGINFIGTVQAQYIRLDIGAMDGSTRRAGLAEINVIQD